ncbi:MAG: hypothetical protein M3X11_05920 [Acidobacteriota bacterium]|nr:hypothetical protein [Acidobacteriota bacterium]
MRPVTLLKIGAVLLIGSVTFAGAKLLVLQDELPVPMKEKLNKLLPYLAARSPGGPSASSDIFLGFTYLPNPSERLRELTSDLKPDETVLFVGASDEPSFTQTFLTVTYINWPRKTVVLGCGATASPPQLLYPPANGVKIKRVLFYRLPPPSALAQSAQALGQHLKVVSVSEQKEWTFYCSQ